MNHTAQHSPAWVTFTYISFAASAFMVGIGIWLLPLDFSMKGYLTMGFLMLTQSCITLTKTMRDMLRMTLIDAGFEVLQAVDGQDGVDALDKEKVDVVITDINMPRMDGYEVIRQLRNNPKHKTTPILVLTTESDTDKRQVARQAGATGWMVKPFDPDRLVATVRKVAP